MVVYRKAGLPTDEAAVKAAVAAFYQRFRQMPRAVVAPTKTVGAVAAVLARLAVRAEVRGSGGVLIPELWMVVDEEEPQGMAPGAPDQSSAAKQLSLISV